MVKVRYALTNAQELEAFFGAFFRFVETASLGSQDAISLSAESSGDPLVRVVTFDNDSTADMFSDYWTKRQKWLGL